MPLDSSEGAWEGWNRENFSLNPASWHALEVAGYQGLSSDDFRAGGEDWDIYMGIRYQIGY